MKKDEIIRRGENVLMNTFDRKDKLLVKGKGTYVNDIYGNKYLDFVSGIATNVLGHADEGMIEIIHQQATTLIHTSNLFWNQPSIELAEKLVKYSGMDKAFFANSGSEANEGAIKLARKWGRETKADKAVEIITMNESFHGRTTGSLAATGQPDMHKDFAPLLSAFKYVPLNDSEALAEVVNENTCAILIETIQGEGGVNPINLAFVETINQLQKEQDVLLIIDEIQTGMGRTGQWFSYQNYDLKPDIITSAKGLGGGFPIGAILAKDHVAKHFGPGDHGTTFGGNPLATAVGNYVIDTIESEHLLDNVKERNLQLVGELEKFKDRFNLIEDIKGEGLLIGLKLRVPVGDVVETSYEHQLLVTNSKDNVLRILPPLNVSENEISEGMDILETVFEKLQEIK